MSHASFTASVNCVKTVYTWLCLDHVPKSELLTGREWGFRVHVKLLEKGQDVLEEIGQRIVARTDVFNRLYAWLLTRTPPWGLERQIQKGGFRCDLPRLVPIQKPLSEPNFLYSTQLIWLSCYTLSTTAHSESRISYKGTRLRCC